MRRIGLLLILGILFWAAAASAQGKPTSGQTSIVPMPIVPRMEISFDYAYVRARTVPATGCCFNMNGGDVSVAVNINRWIGLVGDGSYNYGENVSTSNATLDVVSYTFGPRFSWRKSRHFTPFAEGLLGGGHAGGALYTKVFVPPSPKNSFAMLAGGGLDINVSRHFAIRAVEADWFFTQFPNGGTNRQDNLRLTAGLVFRLGGM